jgi:hypothetical protein
MMTKMTPNEAGEGLPSRNDIQSDLQPAQSRDRLPQESTLPRRRMIGGGSKLGVDCRKVIEAGYHPYWRNDMDGRVQEALANGYEFVHPSEVEETNLHIYGTEMSGDKVSRTVGYTDKGEPIRAYLMKIKEEWFRENQAFYQKRALAIDKAIREGTTTFVEGAYNPKEGISYQSRTR